MRPRNVIKPLLLQSCKVALLQISCAAMLHCNNAAIRTVRVTRWASLAYIAVHGHFRQKLIRVVGVVDAAAVVIETVAHYEKVDVEQHVVGGNLVEHALRYLHRRRLVLDNHARPQLPVVEHAVGSEPLAAYGERNLVGHERGGVALVAYEPVDEVLAHPFLGRESHVAAAQNVEDARMLLGARQLYLKRW